MAKENYSVARVATRTRASIGKFERHIERKNESYENCNVDLSRTPMNVCFKGCGELTYNEYLEQLIADGTVSLRGQKADAKVFDELILDVNTEYFERNGGYEYACRFYEEAFRFAEKLYGKDNVISAVMHADELNIAMTEKYGKSVYHYHLHIMALPVVEKEVRWSKRCKDPALVGTVKEVIHQVSHSKKWKSLKVVNDRGEQVYQKSYSKLQDLFFEHMQEAGYTGFLRGERGSTREHLTATEYKVAQEQKRLNDLETATERAEYQAQAAQQRLDDIAPKLENIEKLTAEYIGDPDQILPTAGAMESGKAYREKKAKPFFKKLLDLLRSVFNAYLDMKSRLDRMQSEYRRVVRSNNSMSERIYSLSEERDGMLAELEDFDRLKKAYGPEQIAATIQKVKEHEQTRKGQKHPRNRYAR